MRPLKPYEENEFMYAFNNSFSGQSRFYVTFSLLNGASTSAIQVHLSFESPR